jgi:hypothetical protein
MSNALPEDVRIERRRESVRRWRERNPELYRQRSREASARYAAKHPEVGRRLNAERQARLRVLIDAAKDVPCARCGVSYPPYVMDFHHRDRSTKKFAVGSGSRSVKATLEEIAKCDVVCSNCHRIIEREIADELSRTSS